LTALRDIPVGGIVSFTNEEYILQVLVRDNNVDQAMRILKKKMQREGIFREMKRRKAYEKPSERRVREKAEAVRRVRKLARKQAQREGLVAKPKPKRPGATRGPRHSGFSSLPVAGERSGACAVAKRSQ
jgi:small subunit ribosomal protein S21